MTSTASPALRRTLHSVPWWRDAVIYQVYVRSFADSDGDGVGDLRGITGRLPYLRDLGVDAVGLEPEAEATLWAYLERAAHFMMNVDEGPQIRELPRNT